MTKSNMQEELKKVQEIFPEAEVSTESTTLYEIYIRSLNIETFITYSKEDEYYSTWGTVKVKSKNLGLVLDVLKAIRKCEEE